MKKTETNATFAIICVAILIGSYGVGFCIREINNSRNAKAETANSNEEMLSNGSADETQEIVYPQDRTNRSREQRLTNRRNTSTGRSSRMGRGMPNFSAEDMASMMEEFQNRGFGRGMRDSQGDQGGFGNFGGFDPSMFGGFGDFGDFDPNALGDFGGQGMFDPNVFGGFSDAGEYDEQSEDEEQNY